MLLHEIREISTNPEFKERIAKIISDKDQLPAGFTMQLVEESHTCARVLNADGNEVVKFGDIEKSNMMSFMVKELPKEVLHQIMGVIDPEWTPPTPQAA